MPDMAGMKAADRIRPSPDRKSGMSPAIDSETGTAAAAVALQAVVFGIGHFYQGIRGVVVITIYGALFGILAILRKSLRPGILQHAGQDVVSGLLGSFAERLLKQYHYAQLLRF